MKTVATVTLQSVTDGIADSLDLTAPVPDIIRQTIHRVAALRATHGSELTALNQIIFNLRGADGIQILRLSDFEQTYLMQERLFRRGQQEGTLREFDTRVMAVTYQGTIDAMLGYLGEYPEVDADRYADSLADFIIAGLTRPPGSPFQEA